MDNNEVIIESMVVSCLFQDMTLVSDYNITSDYFENPKCKFFFQLIEGLSKNYKEICKIKRSHTFSHTFISCIY